MDIKEINIREPLRVCLDTFSGAQGNTREERKKSLSKPFDLLAQKMIYGGYFLVDEEYAIFISKVEFYYHEEKEVPRDRLTDDIVYHRDGRFLERKVPYFPIMTLHSHWSGFDIAFEKETGHYRASALIRQYVVWNLQKRRFVELRTSGNKLKALKHDEKYPPVGEVVYQPDPVIDKRSTYLQYFLNGFSMDGTKSKVEWRDIENIDYPEVNNVPRQHAEEHNWGYTFIDFEEYKEAIKQRTKALGEDRYADLSR